MDTDFQKKRATWIKCLTGDTTDARDPNCIVRQVIDLLHDGVVYRLYAEARQAKYRGNTQDVGMTVFDQLLKKTFAQSQIMAIRRLLDKRGPVKQTGAYTLGWLIEDINRNVGLMTRKNLSAASGYPLDINGLKEWYDTKYAPGGRIANDHSDAHDYVIVQRFHEEMSSQFGWSRDRFKPNDCVPVSVIKQLKESVRNIGDKITAFAGVYIAHAGTSKSRSHKLGDGRHGIAFADLWSMHKSILQAVMFINGSLIRNRTEYGLVIQAYGDPLSGFDEPVASTADMQHLRNFYSGLKLEQRAWEESSGDVFRAGS